MNNLLWSYRRVFCFNPPGDKLENTHRNNTDVTILDILLHKNADKDIIHKLMMISFRSSSLDAIWLQLKSFDILNPYSFLFKMIQEGFCYHGNIICELSIVRRKQNWWQGRRGYFLITGSRRLAVSHAKVACDKTSHVLPNNFQSTK